MATLTTHKTRLSGLAWGCLGGAAILLAGCQGQAQSPGDPRAGGSGGSAVRFFGITDRAESVVYVIDATGANAAAFPYVQAELLRSIESLQPKQRFGVILFGAESPVMLKFGGRSGLAPAGKETVQSARRFILGHREGGAPDEGAAWRAAQAALELVRGDSQAGGRPPVIFLLAQRSWPAELAGRIRQLNAPARAPFGRRPGPVRIHAVGFIDPAAEPLMGRIARANGGQFRFINAVDLGKQP